VKVIAVLVVGSSFVHYISIRSIERSSRRTLLRVPARAQRCAPLPVAGAPALPRVHYRQWVLSLPFRSRYLLAVDARLVSRVLEIFLRAVSAHLRAKAKRLRIPKGTLGAITFVQRFGGSLNPNVHFHCVLADGLFAPSKSGVVKFWQIAAPTDDEVKGIAMKVVRRVLRLILERMPVHETEQPSLLRTAHAAAIQGELSGFDYDHSAEPMKKAKRAAFVDGFSIHTNRTDRNHLRTPPEKRSII